MKITKTRSKRRMNPPVFLVHGPGPVLKTESRWRTLNGVAVRLGDTTYWMEVRQ